MKGVAGMTITEQLAEATRKAERERDEALARAAAMADANEIVQGQFDEAVKMFERSTAIAQKLLAAYEASKAEEERMDCYQYGKVPTQGQDIEVSGIIARALAKCVGRGKCKAP